MLDPAHVISSFRLRDTYRITSSGNCASDILLPQIRIQTIDPYYSFRLSVVYFLQRMIQQQVASRNYQAAMERIRRFDICFENTSNKEIVFGPRTVYVRSGDEWTAVGAFPYAELGAVRVQVWLPRPMDISAIATIANCHAPNLFDFRQTARNFVLLPENG